MAIFKTRSERLALKIERNLIALESAANAGNWEVVSYAALRQEHLLREMIQLDEWTAERFMTWVESRGLVRSISDKQFNQWIYDELEKRGLVPPSAF